MQKLTRTDLYSLEEYAKRREAFRTEVIRHKQQRRLEMGADLVLFFEDRLTMQYQIQEMLRAERIFETAGIQEELDAYNPLIPDGSNWKATLMIQFPDVEERKLALQKFIGVEDRIWLRVGAHEKIYAIADEDLDRETPEKTASVHFLRFELPAASKAAALAGENIAAGIDHPHYHLEIDSLEQRLQTQLRNDLRENSPLDA